MCTAVISASFIDFVLYLKEASHFARRPTLFDTSLFHWEIIGLQMHPRILDYSYIFQFHLPILHIYCKMSTLWYLSTFVYFLPLVTIEYSLTFLLAAICIPVLRWEKSVLFCWMTDRFSALPNWELQFRVPNCLRRGGGDPVSQSNSAHAERSKAGYSCASHLFDGEGERRPTVRS